MRGNHHDAWVNGASDPISGMAPELEEAALSAHWSSRDGNRSAPWSMRRGTAKSRGCSVRPASGWKRTKRNCARRLCSTSAATATVAASSKPVVRTLEHLVNDVAKSVQDPETKGTVWKRWQARQVANGSGDRQAEARSRADLRIGALGSGSDYTPFLQHHGTASLNLSFGGFDEDGIYPPSTTTSITSRSSRTPAFYGRALAQFAGSLVVRIADADVLPFNSPVWRTPRRPTCANCRRCSVSGRMKCANAIRINDGTLAAVADPKLRRPIPAVEDVPPHSASRRSRTLPTLTRAADRYKAATAKAGTDTSMLRQVNARLIQAERQFIDEGGLPRRPWYRHLLCAPGFYTGCGVKNDAGRPRKVSSRSAGRRPRRRCFASPQRSIVKLRSSAVAAADLEAGK